MSSEISRMVRCTGRFFSRMKMTMPKPRPKTQKRRPIIRRRWPSMPRKETDERSGSLRAASPPASSGWARAAEGSSMRVAKRAEIFANLVARSVADVFTNWRAMDARLALVVRIKNPPNDPSGVTTVCLCPGGLWLHQNSEHAPNTLPPQGIIFRGVPIWPRRKTLVRRRTVWRSDYHHGHEAFVYSILREVGSMLVVAF